jgi:hypothetical protein
MQPIQTSFFPQKPPQYKELSEILAWVELFFENNPITSLASSILNSKQIEDCDTMDPTFGLSSLACPLSEGTSFPIDLKVPLNELSQSIDWQPFNVSEDGNGHTLGWSSEAVIIGDSPSLSSLSSDDPLWRHASDCLSLVEAHLARTKRSNMHLFENIIQRRVDQQAMLSHTQVLLF